MDREYNMPKAIQNKLHDIYVSEKHGDCAEQAVLDAASELGYEVEDETETRSRNEKGTYMHNVKLVKREPQGNSVWRETIHSAWAHFNHPGPEYANHRDEWYMYFL